MQAKQRLYLTADRKTVVPEGDRLAAMLYCVVGDEIPESAVARFGLVDGGLPEPASKPAKTKEAPKPANKEAGAGEDKGTSATKPEPEA